VKLAGKQTPGQHGYSPSVRFERNVKSGKREVQLGKVYSEVRETRKGGRPGKKQGLRCWWEIF
jgi:hypothetical protein